MLFLLKFVLAITALVVIILVLLQKGKGGGLAGALGGMGGQSAFGTKAGDLFTKITIGVAAFWIIMCVIAAVAAAHLANEPLGADTGPRGCRSARPAASRPAWHPEAWRRGQCAGTLEASRPNRPSAFAVRQIVFGVR